MKFLSYKVLDLKVSEILVCFGIIVLATILSKIFRYLWMHKFSKLAEFTETDFDDKLIAALEKPLANYIIILGFLIAKLTLFIKDINIEIFISNTINAALIINTSYLAFNVSGVFINIFLPLVNKTKIQLDDEILKFIDKSVKIFICLITIIILIENYINFSPRVSNIVNKIFVMLLTINVIYILIKFTDTFIKYIVKPVVEKTPSKLDDQLLPIIRKIIKVCIFILGVLTILNNLGYDVSALLAGLGIGGLAFALAAKDTLANFFGSIVVFLDQPFQIGDRVLINSKEGDVTEVGLRSTRLKTINGTEIAIPNSEVANSCIENISRRPARRAEMNVSLVYQTTTEKLQAAIEIIKNIIATEPTTAQNEKIVYFSEFQASALNIKVIYWCNEVSLSKFAEIQNKINFQIKTELERAGIEFAYPTQTLYLNKN